MNRDQKWAKSLTRNVYGSMLFKAECYPYGVELCYKQGLRLNCLRNDTYLLM